MSKLILVTGAAGFIGAALVKRLLQNGYVVVGLDNLNDYYEISLKEDRIKDINLYAEGFPGNWHFYKESLEDKFILGKLFKEYTFDIVVNLAAQAGVRFSIDNPSNYIQTNLVGFSNLLEECRKNKIGNLIFASSSSVYGGNRNLPFVETQPVNHPISLYAATKRANELMAHTYSHLHNISCTALRFFTVYGPWGRPDMAPMIFTKSILNKKPINIFNYGNMERDFTYIDDVVEAIIRCCSKPATVSKLFDTKNQDPSISSAPFRIFNIGNSQPVKLLRFIEILESVLGVKAIRNNMPMQPGDVEATAADTKLLENWVGFKPHTKIEDGIKKFAKWYIKYYGD